MQIYTFTSLDILLHSWAFCLPFILLFHSFSFSFFSSFSFFLSVVILYLYIYISLRDEQIHTMFSDLKKEYQIQIDESVSGLSSLVKTIHKQMDIYHQTQEMMNKQLNELENRPVSILPTHLNDVEHKIMNILQPNIMLIQNLQHTVAAHEKKWNDKTKVGNIFLSLSLSFYSFRLFSYNYQHEPFFFFFLSLFHQNHSSFYLTVKLFFCCCYFCLL